MTYKYRYKTNPIFPYQTNTHKLKKRQPLKNISHSTFEDNFHYKNTFNNFPLLNKILEPIEKMIGRKINFDDIILIALIYLLYSEKDNENNVLLLCLIFILLG